MSMTQEPERTRRRGLIVAALAATIVGFHPPALRAADEAGTGRVTLLEENDSLYFNSDKHYTQGFRGSYLTPPLAAESAWNAPFAALPNFPEATPGGRRYSFAFGQSIFTPRELNLKPPDPHDRPYAGWLYLEGNLLQETDRRTLDDVALEIGVVGPGALGKQVQNNFHQLIGKDTAKGWSSQLQNEPGVVLAYDRFWRLPVIGDGDAGLDVVPTVGAAVGNIFTYGAAGGFVRFGRGLSADYGPARIRPALSGSDYFDGSRLADGLGYYFFAGAQGRVVGHNIFLDGNSFRDSASVARKTYVADLQAGFSLYGASSWRVDFSVVRRTEEFVGQTTPDVIGTAALSFAW